MKYLLILVIALVIVWLLKNKRRSDRNEQPPAQKPRTGTQLATTEIVACGVCKVHLPRTEALVGPGGVYCSAAHRQQAAGRS